MLKGPLSSKYMQCTTHNFFAKLLRMLLSDSILGTTHNCVTSRFTLILDKGISHYFLFAFADQNECVNCHGNATCLNINGSFKCACEEGFSGDGLDCLGR